MKALVVERPGEAIVTDIAAPEPGPHDVLLAPARCGLCATDVKIVGGRMPNEIVSYPCVLGHEYSGVVRALGEAVRSFAPGDRVVGEGRIPCGRCERCLAGDTNLCHVFEHVGFGVRGACAELLAVPARVLHGLPEGMSFDAGALIEPAACVVHALEPTRSLEVERVAVVGIGALGAIALQLASWSGYPDITAFGIRAAELELAEALGARAVDSAAIGSPVPGEWASAFDLVVEAAGPSSAQALALALARPGGSVVFLGTAGESAPPSVAADVIVRKELTVRGSLSYTSEDYARTLELAAVGTLDLDSLVTRRCALGDAPEALTSLTDASRRDTKVIVEVA